MHPLPSTRTPTSSQCEAPYLSLTILQGVACWSPPPSARTATDSSSHYCQRCYPADLHTGAVYMMTSPWGHSSGTKEQADMQTLALDVPQNLARLSRLSVISWLKEAVLACHSRRIHPARPCPALLTGLHHWHKDIVRTSRASRMCCRALPERSCDQHQSGQDNLLSCRWSDFSAHQCPASHRRVSQFLWGSQQE